MTIQEQDNKILIAQIIVIALGIIFLAFMEVELYMLFIIAIVMLLLGRALYWIRRKHLFLVTSMKNYLKNTNTTKELELAVVKAAYGNYGLGLVSFKAELKNSPNNEELKNIVSLFEQLIKK